MTQNIEIEFKNILTKEEYEKLMKELKIDKNQIFSQENHYFDTPDFALKQKGSALRIRKKQNNYEMTLKQPAVLGLLETNQILNEEEAIQAIQLGKLPSGIIQTLLEENEIIFSDIEYFGSLKTERVEKEYKNGLLVLDHSYYLNTEDFELEFETTNFQEGKRDFLNLLKEYQIPKRKTENKIKRFYNKKYLQYDSK